MTKSNEIKKQLEQINNKLNELNEMRNQTALKLETLQDGLVTGKATLEAIQSEQNNLNTLESSIKVLEVKQSEFQNAFETAKDAETIESKIASLKTIAEQTGKAFTEYDVLRVELDKTIAVSVEKIISKSAEFYGKQREFRSLCKQLESKQSDISIYDELARLGLAEKTYNIAETEFIHLSPCKFGVSIETAQSLVLSERYRAEKAISDAEAAEERYQIRQAQAAKQHEDQEKIKQAVETERQRIIKYRKDNELPELTPHELQDAVDRANISIRT